MKRQSPVRNIQHLFSIYDSGHTDKTSERLRTLFKITVYLMLAFPLGLVLEEKFGNGIAGKIGTAGASAAGFAWFISIILFCLMGAHSYGKSIGTNSFASSLLSVLGKNFYVRYIACNCSNSFVNHLGNNHQTADLSVIFVVLKCRIGDSRFKINKYAYTKP